MTIGMNNVQLGTLQLGLLRIFHEVAAQGDLMKMLTSSKMSLKELEEKTPAEAATQTRSPLSLRDKLDMKRLCSVNVCDMHPR